MLPLCLIDERLILNMEETEKMLFRGRLDGKQRLRLEKLLDMLYKPGELAEEIGFTRRQVYRVYMHFGCPNVRDEQRHIWINGKAFREWYEATYPRFTVNDGEGFCLTCKRVVKLENSLRAKKGGLVYWIGYCPKCGRKIPRIISNDKQRT
jgi:hypothetical protein